MVSQHEDQNDLEDQYPPLYLRRLKAVYEKVLRNRKNGLEIVENYQRPPSHQTVCIDDSSHQGQGRQTHLKK